MGAGNNIKRQVSRVNAAIANGASLSAAVELEGFVIFAIALPAVWTAAAMTFQSSLDGVTWGDVFDDAGAEVTIAAGTIVAGRFLVNSTILEKLAGLSKLRVRSGISGAAVAQVAARDIIIILKG